MIRRSLPTLLFVGTLALGAAGCGGDDGGDAGAPSTTAATGGGGVDAAAVQRGQQLAKDRGCQSCHKIEGAGIGPTWVGLYGSTVTLDDGSTVVADDAYLHRSIEDPSAQKAEGFDVAMPQIALDPNEIDDLVAYIHSLGAPSGAVTTTSAAPGAPRRRACRERASLRAGEPMSRTRAIVAALGAAVSLLAACGGGGSHEFVGYTRDSEPVVDVAALPDLSNGGQPFEMRAQPGHLLVVYFGYTNCPDFCPTTMTNVARAQQDLGDDGSRIDVAMVTVDPERDTAVLADYVRSFVPDAHALATDDAALLATVAEPFGVSYQVSTKPDGSIDVAHTTFLYAVDEHGSLVITWPSGTSADDLAADLRQLLRDAADDAS